MMTRSHWAAWVFVLASFLLGAAAYAVLPANAIIATHLNAYGQPNGFMPKAWGLSVIPLIAVMVVGSLTLLPNVYPDRERLERSKGPLGLVLAGVAGVLLVSEFAIAAKAFKLDVDALRLTLFAVAVLLAVVGNVLGKVRQNWILGIRTRWTLSDERVWDKTHRFTGKAMVIAAFVLAAFVAFGPSGPPLVAAVILCAAGPALLGAVYSWWLSRGGPRSASRQT